VQSASGGQQTIKLSNENSELFRLVNRRYARRTFGGRHPQLRERYWTREPVAEYNVAMAIPPTVASFLYRPSYVVALTIHLSRTESSAYSLAE